MRILSPRGSMWLSSKCSRRRSVLRDGLRYRGQRSLSSREVHPLRVHMSASVQLRCDWLLFTWWSSPTCMSASHSCSVVLQWGAVVLEALMPLSVWFISIVSLHAPAPIHAVGRDLSPVSLLFSRQFSKMHSLGQLSTRSVASAELYVVRSCFASLSSSRPCLGFFVVLCDVRGKDSALWLSWFDLSVR